MNAAFALALLAAQSGASARLPDDHAERMTAGLAKFREQIEPLLKAQCLRCHGGESTRGSFDLVTREELLKGSKHGEVVVPFDAAGSRLLRLVRHEEAPAMPWKSPALDETAVASLAEWIDLGAPYAGPLVERKDAKRTGPREVTAADRDFWSFRPLARPPPPSFAADGPLAPRRVLLRRLWFDLVGLPPPPEEIDAFVADPADEDVAWARRVDALLASPRFGERWARHWLDLARYAESHGFEHDTDRPYAWPYRDYVIDAFNRDQPFDEFVRWQIAGDEIAPDDPQAWFATGFLGAGVHATQITMNQVEKERYDELDDMVATIGTSMLGLTIGCARCHDHKFDPIPTRDYYRMAAMFTRTVRSDFDVVLDAPQQRERLAAWQAEHDRLVAAGVGEAEGFRTLEPSTLESTGGATSTRQPDGSWLAGGERAERDEYRFVATLAPVKAGETATLASLRIDALADPSLPHGGPGRADNGNFGLTELRATWTPAGGGKPLAVALRDARSTFDQAGLPAGAAIDGVGANESACWAIDPRFGADHAAAFALATPIDARLGGELTLRLLFRTNVFHSIGRLRVRVAARADVPLRSAIERHLDDKPRPATQKALVCSEGLPAIRLHTQGGDFLEATHFLQRGDCNQKLEEATPSFLQVLVRAPAGDADASGRWSVTPPDGARTPWQRRALAAWITDVDAGAGNLLARVIANRLWQHLFGRGIVATPSDFGEMGARPTDPARLEWLACELVDGGFRVKHLLRELVTSPLYRQRQPPRRLEAEAIRDALLCVSGVLDLTMHGPGSLDVASPRRSVYLSVKRSQLVPMLALFDAPNALGGIGVRSTTTVAPQALFLLDAPAARGWAEAFARRLERETAGADGPAAPADLVRRAFALCYGRPPDDAELADAVAFLADQAGALAQEGVADAPFRARVDLAQALLSSNEFVYLE